MHHRHRLAEPFDETRRELDSILDREVHSFAASRRDHVDRLRDAEDGEWVALDGAIGEHERDVGTFRAFVDCALRDAIEAGVVVGPRMMCAGAYVTCSGGGGDVTGLAPDVDAVVPLDLRFGVADSADEVRKRVRKILHGGADFIKVIATGAIAVALLPRTGRAKASHFPLRT